MDKRRNRSYVKFSKSNNNNNGEMNENNYTRDQLIKFIKNKKLQFSSKYDYNGSLSFLNAKNKALEYMYLDDCISEDENTTQRTIKLDSNE